MGNRDSIIRAVDWIESFQNNKKILNIKNNNIKIHHDRGLRDNKRFFEQRSVEITVKKNNFKNDVGTSFHP